MAIDQDHRTAPQRPVPGGDIVAARSEEQESERIPSWRERARSRELATKALVAAAAAVVLAPISHVAAIAAVVLAPAVSDFVGDAVARRRWSARRIWGVCALLAFLGYGEDAYAATPRRPRRRRGGAHWSPAVHVCTVAVVVAGLTIPDVVLGHALIGSGRYTLFGGTPPGGRPNHLPAAPTGLAGRSPTTHRPALRWNADAGAARYVVYRNGARVATTTRPAFTDGHVGHGTYAYRVAAVTAAGAEGRRSAPVTVVYQSAHAPAAPTGLTGVSPTAQPPALSWNPVPGSQRYVVFRDGSVIARPHQPAFTDAGVGHGTHSYRVAYVGRGGGQSRESAPFAITYEADAPPPAPTGLTAPSPTRTQPELSWNAVPGATNYTVYRDSTRLGHVDGTRFRDGSLTADATYRYAVSATDSAGVASARSHAIAVVYDTTPPAIPTGLASQDQLITDPPSLAWQPVADAVSYTLFRDDVPIHTGPAVAYTDTGAPLGPETYTVTAQDAAGNTSGRSVGVTVTYAQLTLSGQSPTAVYPALSWTSVPGCAYYIVDRNDVAIKQTKGVTTYLDTTVPGAATYAYEVICVSPVGADIGHSNVLDVVYTPLS
jgi:fibronectin type 3 domain-containing protein